MHCQMSFFNGQWGNSHPAWVLFHLEWLLPLHSIKARNRAAYNKDQNITSSLPDSQDSSALSGCPCTVFKQFLKSVLRQCFFCVPVRWLFLKTLLQKIKPHPLQVSYYPPRFFSIDSVLHIQEAQSRHSLSTFYYTIHFFHNKLHLCLCTSFQSSKTGEMTLKKY